MSRFYNRIRGAFRRDRPASKPYYDPASPSEDSRKDSPNRPGGNQSRDNDDDDYEARSVRNNTPLQPTPAEEQRGRSPSIDEDPPSPPANPRNPETRPAPNLSSANPRIPEIRSSPNVPPANISPAIDPNPNQRLLPSQNATPQPSTNASLSALRNRRRRPFTINPNSQLVGFPRNRNLAPSWALTSSFTPHRRSRPPPTLPQRPNTYNRDFDYPVENVFNDRNTSPSFMLDVTEPIDYDRFSHHRAYKPRTHHLECRLVEDSPQPNARYMREIHYPQVQNSNNIQLFIDTNPSLTWFPAPIRHYTAHALPNDPMRYY